VEHEETIYHQHSGIEKTVSYKQGQNIVSIPSDYWGGGAPQCHELNDCFNCTLGNCLWTPNEKAG